MKQRLMVGALLVLLGLLAMAFGGCMKSHAVGPQRVLESVAAGLVGVGPGRPPAA